MEKTQFEKLLIQTAFCCVASDGAIDPKEIRTIESLCNDSESFGEFDFKKEINSLVDQINVKGKDFLHDFLDHLKGSDLSKEEELKILDFAIKAIYADERIEYSEVKFFKTIRYRLNITDEEIREVFPDLDDNFIEEDIKTDSFLENITKQFLESTELPKFDIKDFQS